MKNYILAIDQGTTGTTVLVIDRQGAVRGRGYAEIKQYYPYPGWVEQDAEDIWTKTLLAMRKAKENAGIDDGDIAAIGITNQRETTLLVDRKSGKAVGRAIVWQCRRTAERCAELRTSGYADTIRRKTGLVIDAYFSATKLQWLLEHATPELRSRAKSGEIIFCTIDAWLIWKLTDCRIHATDYTNASRTMLFNINTLDWDDDLLGIFDIPRSMLPELHPSCHIVGHTESGIPIAGVAGDQSSALFGQGCFETGMTKVSYGTGAFLLMHTGSKAVTSNHGLLTTLACSTDEKPQYALEGSIFIAGAVIQWLRDELGLIEKAEESEQIAMKITNTGGVYLVPAFVGLGAPHWDMSARGTIVGLTRGSGRAQIVRAAVESIAYQVADVLDALTSDSQLTAEEIRVDGGATGNDFLMQFQSDIAGAKVNRPQMIETTALGAAHLAGLATGFWSSRQELSSLRVTDREFLPDMNDERRQLLRSGWNRAIRQARGLTADS